MSEKLKHFLQLLIQNATKITQNYHDLRITTKKEIIIKQF